MFGMPGTNVYTVWFYFGAAIAAILVICWPLFPMWRKYFKRVEVAQKTEGSNYPNIVGPLIATLVVVVVFISAATLVYNAMQGVTTHSSNYQNPAEEAEKKAIQETRLPSKEEMDKTRAEQKGRANIKPHQQALSDYDAAMEREAEKIKKRSIDSPTTESANTRSK